MASADELRASVAAGRTVLAHAVTMAAERWETPGPDEADGPGWSPRQAAEHALQVELEFAKAICAAAGCNAPASPLDGAIALASADDALAALADISATIDPAVGPVRDDQLGDTAADGMMAGMAVRDMWAFAIWHLTGHASQIYGPMDNG